MHKATPNLIRLGHEDIHGARWRHKGHGLPEGPFIVYRTRLESRRNMSKYNSVKMRKVK